MKKMVIRHGRVIETETVDLNKYRSKTPEKRKIRKPQFETFYYVEKYWINAVADALRSSQQLMCALELFRRWYVYGADGAVPSGLVRNIDRHVKYRTLKTLARVKLIEMTEQGRGRSPLFRPIWSRWNT